MKKQRVVEAFKIMICHVATHMSERLIDIKSLRLVTKSCKLTLEKYTKTFHVFAFCWPKVPNIPNSTTAWVTVPNCLDTFTYMHRVPRCTTTQVLALNFVYNLMSIGTLTSYEGKYMYSNVDHSDFGYTLISNNYNEFRDSETDIGAITFQFVREK